MSNKLLLCLLAVELLLIVSHVLFGQRFDLLNLDRERTPAAVFAALQLIGVGYALVTLAITNRSRTQRALWILSAVLFTLLGLDEISELHENAAYYLVKYFPPFPFFHSGTPMWIVFLSPIIAASFALAVWIVRRIGREEKKLGWVAACGLFFFALALALEFVGGLRTVQPYLHLLVPLEEGLELIAGTLFLFSTSRLARNAFLSTFRRF